MNVEVALSAGKSILAVKSDRLQSRYDATFVARLALREKQVQQSYRPIIQIHKWFARRPGSVFRSLLLSEFGDSALSGDYFQSHHISGTIADPFMGGGTTAFEAARLGLSVIGSDVNPMAYWTVRQAVSPLDLRRFQREANLVMEDICEEIGDLYKTTCTLCCQPADVKYFHLVKTCLCPSCGQSVDLFPGLRLAEAVRHPKEVYHCPQCNVLREVKKSEHPRCPECHQDFKERQTQRGRVTCRNCGDNFKFAPLLAHPPKHRMYGIEYRCARCYSQVQGRQFKTPDAEDLARVSLAKQLLEEKREQLLIPDQEIPPGDETARLHRWGYRRWSELFSDRQLLGLGILMRRIGEVEHVESRYALATVFSDFLRYQNLLCRYDTYALKCQDIFAVHGFPVAQLACENSLIGVPRVGSGSFVHFVNKYIKAKEYAKKPFETRYEGRRKVVVPVAGESIEIPLTDNEPSEGKQGAWLTAAPSQTLALRPASLDGVFTDPPYFDMVQYAELMDFCYVWLRKFMIGRPEFLLETTCTDSELTGNTTRLRGMQEFTEGLSGVFCQMAAALKPGAPLVFTYHHNDPSAYVPLIVAILDAGLTCTATLVAPGEMSASLHIAGTKSSILDSVFVCRKERIASGDLLSVDERVAVDAAAMRKVPYEPTQGDLMCLRAGHAAADAIRALRAAWDSTESLERRLKIATQAVLQAVSPREETL